MHLLESGLQDYVMIVCLSFEDRIMQGLFDVQNHSRISCCV